MSAEMCRFWSASRRDANPRVLIGKVETDFGVEVDDGERCDIGVFVMGYVAVLPK